jgi:hypothetical protein
MPAAACRTLGASTTSDMIDSCLTQQSLIESIVDLDVPNCQTALNLSVKLLPSIAPMDFSICSAASRCWLQV